jgi:hypothetical protein
VLRTKLSITAHLSPNPADATRRFCLAESGLLF